MPIETWSHTDVDKVRDWILDNYAGPVPKPVAIYLDQLAAEGLLRAELMTVKNGKSSFLDPEQLGPTGKFPDGKICEDDQGELRFAVSSDIQRKLVVFQFGELVSWVGFPPGQAREIAKRLLDHANKVEGKE
jgi:hypothetical protein